MEPQTKVIGALDGIRALVASPTYAHVNPICAQSLRAAMASASNAGIKWVGDVSNDRLGYAFTRNLSASVLRKTPDVAHGILWVDSDILVPSDAIIRLLRTTVTHPQIDFISGIYHARKSPFLPVIYHWDETVKKYLQCVDYPENEIRSIDGCGFGFVWTSSRVINTIADHPGFSAQYGWFPDRRDTGGYGEDISFCDQAKQAGLHLYMDTGVQLGHEGDAPFITSKDFRALKLTINSPEVQNRPKADWFKAT